MARLDPATNFEEASIGREAGAPSDLAVLLSVLARLQVEEQLVILKRDAALRTNDASSIEGQLLAAMRDGESSLAARTISTYLVRQRRRELAHPASLQPIESPLDRLRDAAAKHVVEHLLSKSGEPETGRADGRFVQLAYELVLERGCGPHELHEAQLALERGNQTRAEFLIQLCAAHLTEAETERVSEALHDGLSLHVMGTGQRVTLADWRARAEQLKSTTCIEPPPPCARFVLATPPRLCISAIASVYRAGRFIRRFMENITGQTCFAHYAELIIVDADSPDDEYEVIRPYLDRYRNIKYIRADRRIGIYEAWNRGVAEARGEYLTCTNVDDLRRSDSFELQAATLDALPFADVVYQDFFYTFDPALTFEEVASFGYRSCLPQVSRYALLACNPPHNAPMWRRRLHDELGLFDTSYESAGDFDFWMRCVAAGKTFFKLNDPHVAYYQNPEGISTRAGTRGFSETKAVHRRRDREIVSELLVMPIAQFRERLLHLLPATSEDGDPDRARLCQLALNECARRIKHRSPTLRAAA